MEQDIPGLRTSFPLDPGHTPIPAKLVREILEGKLINMAELLQEKTVIEDALSATVCDHVLTAYNQHRDRDLLPYMTLLLIADVLTLWWKCVAQLRYSLLALPIGDLPLPNGIGRPSKL